MLQRSKESAQQTQAMIPNHKGSQPSVARVIKNMKLLNIIIQDKILL